MPKISELPDATDPVGPEPVPTVQGAATKKLTVQQIVDATLAAHDAETFAHDAAHIESVSTVGQGDVEADLDWLHANTPGNSAIKVEAVSSGSGTTNINTDSTEATLISFTLPANTLDADGDVLSIEAGGDILANSGSPTFTWKLKSGSAVLDTPAAAMTTSANLRRWKLRAEIRRETSTPAGASVAIGANLTISQAIATTDWNLADAAHTWVGNLVDISGQDLTVDTTIAFTVQMSVSNANNRVRMYGYAAHKVAA